MTLLSGALKGKTLNDASKINCMRCLRNMGFAQSTDHSDCKWAINLGKVSEFSNDLNNLTINDIGDPNKTRFPAIGDKTPGLDSFTCFNKNTGFMRTSGIFP